MSDRALHAARDRLVARGARLGEVRLVERQVEWLQVRNGQVETCSRTVSRGLGIRALAGGWGFAASDDLSDPVAVADRAVDLAESVGHLSYDKIDVGEYPPQQGQWVAKVEEDPFLVPLDEKIDWLVSATEAMKGVEVARANAMSLRRSTRLVTTEGSDLHQEQTVVGVSIGATAVGGGLVQQRNWPKSEEGNLAGRGWEHARAHDLVGMAPEVAEEARLLVEAPKVPEGLHDIILDGAQLSLQIHESCGHPVEGDRVLGEEMSLAGGSFLQPGFQGERYGSDRVNLYAESSTKGAAGSFGWDDEGSPSARVDLVREGRFAGWLTGRESSQRLGAPHAAAMRAENWSSVPIVRMVNVNLAPGNAGSLDDLVASTERGLLLSRNRAWSIDQLRLNFQFGCEAAYEIVDGEIKRLLRDPLYTGRTPAFWQSCDAICGPEAWNHWGWAFCGKGDPPQLIHVSHGCAPARFRGVQLL